MIVCSCNVLTDATIKRPSPGRAVRLVRARRAPFINASVAAPIAGRCMKTVRKIIREALGDAPSACVNEACQPQDLRVCEPETLAVTEEQVFFPDRSLKSRRNSVLASGQTGLPQPSSLLTFGSVDQFWRPA